MNHSSAITRTASLSLIFVLLVGIAAAAYIYYSTSQNSVARNCDTQLSNQIGATNFCLQPMSVVLSSSNASEYYVPALIMKPGSNASLTILYHDVIKTSPTNAYPPFTTNSRPYLLSVPSGRITVIGVNFSGGTLLFQNGTWTIYRYSFTTSSNFSGIYMILPPFYFGFYPAIIVGDTTPNASLLSMWGFSGIMETGEFVLPSTIVGTTNLQSVNVTVPSISACPNAACEVILRSQY